MEDRISPLAPDVIKIRELISSFELCHHKADRWVGNIIEAIGTGGSGKGLGTRSPGQLHPAEKTWQNACAALSAWCEGSRSAAVDLWVDTVPASRLLACLGERSPLKQWQVRRVIEKVRSFVHWPRSEEDPTGQYRWILLGGGEYELAYRDQCPEHCKEHEDFWLATVRTIIHDTANEKEAALSLGLAIDMLWPCHWGFVENLQVVLEAIGGKLSPEKPFAACGRNICLLPTRQRMEIVRNTLRLFGGAPEANEQVDTEILAQLGEPTEVKRWLAASLEKTLRLQLDPPAELEAMAALEGPDWIRQ